MAVWHWKVDRIEASLLMRKKYPSMDLVTDSLSWLQERHPATQILAPVTLQVAQSHCLSKKWLINNWC